MKPGGGRAKGAAFEREVASMLYDRLGIKFRRELTQYQISGLGDLVPVDDAPDWPFVIECKRYASGSIKPEWWGQVITAARKAELFPALIVRFDRREIVCRVPIDAFEKMVGGPYKHGFHRSCDVDFSTFCYLTRELLAAGHKARTIRENRDCITS